MLAGTKKTLDFKGRRRCGMIKAYGEVVKESSSAKKRTRPELIREASRDLDCPVILNDQIHAMKKGGQNRPGHDSCEVVNGT